jgi:carboxylesterase type B
MKGFSGIATLATLLPTIVLANPTKNELPKVDLGYEIYRATSHNDTNGLYSFSNIRYAAPPTGKNRFNAPQPPAQNRSTVQFNRSESICPQANPLWNLQAQAFLLQYFKGIRSFNQSDFDLGLPSNFTIDNINLDTFDTSIIPTIDPRTTEDCLFLDVVVPQKIFKKKAKKGKGAAVLVWIYGGGYTAGSKGSYNAANGLLARSQDGEDDEGLIYVALNYRLGAFGWLSGPTFQENGTANAGLWDQRFALEWVQKHISKFGGDPDRVTVFGESAGGGSIMGQITAFGGKKGPAPFAQVS